MQVYLLSRIALSSRLLSCRREPGAAAALLPSGDIRKSFVSCTVLSPFLFRAVAIYGLQSECIHPTIFVSNEWGRIAVQKLATYPSRLLTSPPLQWHSDMPVAASERKTIAGHFRKSKCMPSAGSEGEAGRKMRRTGGNEEKMAKVKLSAGG